MWFAVIIGGTIRVAAASSGYGLVGILIISLLGFAGLFVLTSFAFWRVRKFFPNANQREEGKLYGSGIGGRAGIIFDKSVEFRWRYDDQPHWFVKPDFVVTSDGVTEVLRIRRYKRFPPCFQTIEKGQVTGIIRLRSIPLNKYSLEITSGPTWTFLMPLYTVHFRGASSDGGRVWIQIGPRTKLKWNILVMPGCDTIQILSTIAFIHRRWYL